MYRWDSRDFLSAIGINIMNRRKSFKYFFLGIYYAFLLLLFILIPLFLGSWAKWNVLLESSIIFNSILLCLGVGFAEEVLFRGWLFGEMNHLFGSRLALVLQAAIFSLVHVRFDLGFWSLFGLLVGLFLLGLVLALLRRIDHGSLWGCVGLHGGLVGGWFFISNALVEVKAGFPSWLFGSGSGGPDFNPIGGLLAILMLLMILLFQRTALAIVR